MDSSGRRWLSAVGIALTMTISLAACSPAQNATDGSQGVANSIARGSADGSSYLGVTATTPTPTRQTRSTQTVSIAPSTITTIPSDATLVQPPPTTSEPAPTPGECPYLQDKQVMYANGQHTGATTIIDTDPYPVCIFTRSDGGYMATTRIVVADTDEGAAAAVNQHVPVDESNPATHPAGWEGGAMGNLDGVDGYPGAHSIYAVAKGKIAIIAISNQEQSIKGRQMVQDIVDNLDL